MLEGIEAVIYDMDGILIDSEPLWRRAMIEGFTGIGIPFTEDDCRVTTGMRFVEVVQFWFNRHSHTGISVGEFNNRVIERLQALIMAEGAPMAGVMDSIAFFRQRGLKLALGTSSSHGLIDTVLAKLQLKGLFEAVCSAEHLAYGKPHPEIFLHCAAQLQVLPQHCMVIEDSVNGVIAAKAALMKAVAIPEKENFDNPKYAIADHKFGSLSDFLAKI